MNDQCDHLDKIRLFKKKTQSLNCSVDNYWNVTNLHPYYYPNFIIQSNYPSMISLDLIKEETNNEQFPNTDSIKSNSLNFEKSLQNQKHLEFCSNLDIHLMCHGNNNNNNGDKINYFNPIRSKALTLAYPNEMIKIPKLKKIKNKFKLWSQSIINFNLRHQILMTKTQTLTPNHIKSKSQTFDFINQNPIQTSSKFAKLNIM